MTISSNFRRLLHLLFVSLVLSTPGLAEPLITSQPVSQTVAQGAQAVFSVTASPADSYQWYKNGSPITVGPISTFRNLTLQGAAPNHSGLYHVVVTSGGESVASEPARLTVVPRATLRLVGRIPDEGNAMWVQVVGDRAYVADNVFRIYDVGDPANAVKLGEFGTASMNIRGLYISGATAFITENQNRHLIIVDIANPAEPVELGRIKLQDTPADVVVRNGLAYVATFKGMEIIDVSDPVNLRRVSHWGSAVYFTLEIVSDIVYLAANVATGGGHVVDVSDPAAPGQILTLPSPAWADTVKAKDNRLYLGGKENFIYDISNPREPRLLGQTPSNGNFGTAGMGTDGEFIFAGGDGLSIFDVSDPANAVLIGRYKSSSYQPQAVAVAGNLIFVAAGGGVDILEWTPATSVPVVTAPLSPVITAKGSSPVLFGHASGGEPMRWQWYRDGELLEGETNRLLTLSSALEVDSSTYSVSAINSAGATSLGEATVTLIDPAPLELDIELGDSRGPRLMLHLPEGVQGQIEASRNLETWNPVWSGQVRETPVEVFDFFGGDDPQRTYRFRYGMGD